MLKKILYIIIFSLLLCGCSSAQTSNGLKDSKADTNVQSDEVTGEKETDPMAAKSIYLAGGCFWGVQKFFDQFDGVIYTEVGYANGPDQAPSYSEVCEGSGHAETVKIQYNEDLISLTELLEYYFMVIDPLSVNKQGNDRGVQYRTGIYYTDESQLPEIEAVYKAQEEKAGAELAVEVEPLKNFYSAEDYHQKYLDKNIFGYCHIPAAMFKLQEQKDREENKSVTGGNSREPVSGSDSKTGENGQDTGNSTGSRTEENGQATLGVTGNRDQWKNESKAELKERIGDLSYDVTQNAGTEWAFTGEYDEFFEKGLYVDIVSGEALFTSMDKYNSGCGWPAFTKPVNEDAVVENTDTSHGMVRTEVRSSDANSHLGHVFTDGPSESGGLRYCINSAALRFIPYEELDEQGYGEYKALFDE